MAISLVGFALTVLAVILGYIRRANTRSTKLLLESQERLRKGMGGIALMVKDVHKGQKEMAKPLTQMYKEVAANNFEIRT